MASWVWLGQTWRVTGKVETEISDRKSRKSDYLAYRENTDKDSRVRKISLEIFIFI
jgi:hypothetical protein